MLEPQYTFCPLCQTLLSAATATKPQTCPHCHWKKRLHTPQVSECIVTRDNHILLAKRARDPFKGLWSLPGGFAQYGELAYQAACRELLEETGLKASYWGYVGQYLSDQHPQTQSIVTGIAIKTNNYTYQAADDAAEVKWFDVFSLPPLAFTCHYQLIEDYFLLEKNIRYQPVVIS
jgi:8-oxo-dGTP diphosphatase